MASSFVAVTLFLEVPAKFLTTMSDAEHYFLIGTLFNGLRILALAVAVGHLYDRLDRSSGT
jgi:hypothetical protein